MLPRAVTRPIYTASNEFVSTKFVDTKCVAQFLPRDATHIAVMIAR